MDWDEVALRPTGNEIRFADEIHRRWTISPPLAGTISAPAERTGGERSERSEDFVAAYAAISSTLCVDFVAATAAISLAVLPGAVRLPMDWDEGMLRPTGNEIRFEDEIQPGGLDDIPADGGDDIRSCGADRGEKPA